MEYTIIEEYYRDVFISKVNEMLNEGWELQGDVSFDYDNYHQAMIRRDK